MKKTAALICVLVMCMALCACGKNNDDSTNDSKTTESAAENVMESPNDESAEFITEEIEAIGSAFENHALIAKICGEWEIPPGYEDYDLPFRSLVVNEDGTCVIDGVSATWKVSEAWTSEDQLYIEIYVESEVVCMASCNNRGDFLGGYEPNGAATIGSYNRVAE